MAVLRNPRGTRAALDALASASGIVPGQIYVLMDESRISVGLTSTTYETYAKTSEIGGGGGGSSSATSKVTRSAIALGSFPANQTDFTYVTLPAVAARGLMTQLIVGASIVGLFDLVVRGAASEAGSLWLQALSVATRSYSVSLPIYIENDAGGQDFFVGIRNRGNSAATFTLSNLRIERFA